MGASGGPDIVDDGLTMYIDAANTKSYPGSGSTLSDITGLGRNGTLTNGPTFSSANQGAIVFDGANDFIDTGYDLSWNHTNSVSICITLRPASLTQNTPFLGKGPSLWEWNFNQRGGSFQFVYWDQTGSHSNGPIPEVANVFTSTTTFTHISFIWDHALNKVFIFNNGALVKDATWVNASINQNRSTQFTIGGNIYKWGSNLTSSFWSGSIAQVLIYNRALSSAEVTQNFNAIRGRYGI